jgi:hypothetical protein
VPAVKRIEDRDAIGTDHYRLAVHGERLGAELAGSRGDGGVSVGPIMAAARE